MAININGLGTPTTIGKNDRLQKAPEADSGKSSEGTSVNSKDTLAEDTVQLSGAAQVLKDQEAKIARLPDVNMDRVEQIKQAIAAGEYKIDTQKLAGNMLAIDALFS